MNDTDKINIIIENLKKQDQQDYGIAVFDVYSKYAEKGIMLLGNVLSENQKDKILELAKIEKINIANNRIKVLSNASRRYEIGWVVVKNEIADLKLRFVSNKIINEKILKRIRCAQTFKGEILRVLYKNEDQLLAQQNDLTLGWVNRNDVIVKKDSLWREWKKGNFAIKGQVIKIKDDQIAKKFHANTPLAPLKRGIGALESLDRIIKIDCHSELDSESVVDFKKNPLVRKRKIISNKKILDNIIKEAEKYLGTKYLLGGKTEKGTDCSGLIQIAYKNALGIILPKHSWDQKEMGKEVAMEDLKTGDLVFLRKKSNRHKHVGLIKRNENTINLIHASLDQKMVVRQDLEKVFENYEFVQARRIVEKKREK